MSEYPQPPPDVPAPPPGRAAKRSWVVMGVLIALGLSALGLFGHRELERRKEARITKMFRYFRSLGYCMVNFDSEYGTFPDDETLADVCTASGQAPWPLITSNDYFRQMIVARTPEMIFSDGGLSGWTRKADGIVRPRSKALEAGECAWAYFPHSSSGHPGRPILAYPADSRDLPLRSQASRRQGDLPAFGQQHDRRENRKRWSRACRRDGLLRSTPTHVGREDSGCEMARAIAGCCGNPAISYHVPVR